MYEGAAMTYVLLLTKIWTSRLQQFNKCIYFRKAIPTILTPFTTSSKRIWILIPIIGIFLFVILYIIAAILYPGGSGENTTAAGYSWTENYWCNLLSEKAINGQINTARPVAITAMMILCISLSSFWLIFPALAQLKKNHSLLIQVAGVASMLTSFLLLTGINHDLAINTSTSLGCIALIGTMIALHQLKWNSFFAFGLFNVLLIGLNNYLYHHELLTYLPVVQKFTFLSFLTWFCLIVLRLYTITQGKLDTGQRKRSQ